MRPDSDEHDAAEPAAIMIAAVFGRAAATYDTIFPFFTRVGARIVDQAGLQPGERVLDVGCGRGATLLLAAAQVGPDGSVLGVDLAPEMVSMLAADLDRLGVGNATVRCADAETLDLGASYVGAFDVVISGFVVHLLVDPGRALAAYLRALRPGGRAVLSVPIADGPEWDFLEGLYKELLPRAARPPAIPLRPGLDLAAEMASAGFEVERIVEEEERLRFAGAEGWWAWGWSNGVRDLYETLAPDDLEELRQKVFAELDSRTNAEGLTLRMGAKVVVGYRPAEQLPAS